MKKYSISKDLYFKGFYEKLNGSFIVYRNLTHHNSKNIKKIIDGDTIVVNKKSFFIKEIYYYSLCLFL